MTTVLEPVFSRCFLSALTTPYCLRKARLCGVLSMNTRSPGRQTPAPTLHATAHCGHAGALGANLHPHLHPRCSHVPPTSPAPPPQAKAEVVALQQRLAASNLAHAEVAHAAQCALLEVGSDLGGTDQGYGGGGSSTGSAGSSYGGAAPGGVTVCSEPADKAAAVAKALQRVRRITVDVMAACDRDRRSQDAPVATQ